MFKSNNILLTRMLQGLGRYMHPFVSDSDNGHYRSVWSMIALLVIVAGNSSLAVVIAYQLFDYKAIYIGWKIAFLAFIYLLPFFFYLIISLHVDHIKTERELTLQSAFKKYYDENGSKIKEELRELQGGILNPADFERIVKDIDISLLRNAQDLCGIYRQLIQLYRVKQKNKNSQDASVIGRQILSFQVEEFLPNIINHELISQRLDFESYLLPLLFFLFTYFSGFFILLPFINSIFLHAPLNESFVIPLFDVKKSIPILVIQWGFLGGLTYTSIYFLSRFLRKDLSPRVYAVGALRLLLSSVVAVVIYLSTAYGYVYSQIPVQVLLACFLAGVTPIQFLINFADSQLYKYLPGWKRIEAAGNRTLTQIVGVDSLDAERLSEEGIDCIHRMAFANPNDLAKRTKFPVGTIEDWKEQSVLFLLTADVIINQKNNNKSDKIYLFDHLANRLAIRSMAGLEEFWKRMDAEKNQDDTLLRALDLQDYSLNANTIHHIFENIISQGQGIISSSDVYKRQDLPDRQMTSKQNH